ncbi:MAG: O-antigen ligase family protein [Leptolinea sp.]|nr:O-antigen ligase family protein [Leptolinea sp.]
MIQGSLRQGIAVEDSTQLLLAGVVGVLLGLAFAYVPATYIAIAMVALFVVILAIKSPQYAILAFLFIHSTFLSGDELPRLGVGGINIWITDMILVGLLALIAARLLVDHKFKIFRSPVIVPLLTFIIWVVFTTLRGYFYGGSSRWDMVIETRIALYYLLTFCCIYLIKRESEIKSLLRWFYLLAVVASVFVIIQFALGFQVSFLSSGKIYEFSSTGGPVVARVQGTVGEGLITFALVLKTITMFIEKFRVSKIYDLLQWLVIASALVTTFNRTHWLIVFISLLVAAFFVGRREKQRVYIWGMIVMIVVVGMSSFIVMYSPQSRAASLINAGLSRLLTLTQLAEYTDPEVSTVVWRNFEYEYGIPQVLKNPIMGIGLGARYRPTLEHDYPGFTGELYTHNSNLWIAMKTGLPGLFLYLWFSNAYVWHALKNWKLIKDIPQRGFVLGSGIGIFIALLGANLHPFGMTLEWVPVISIIIGLGEAIIYHQYCQMDIT